MVRASGVEALIAILEDEYSLPGQAPGPLSTSIEWNKVKRLLIGIDPLAEHLSDN